MTVRACELVLEKCKEKDNDKISGKYLHLYLD